LLNSTAIAHLFIVPPVPNINKGSYPSSLTIPNTSPGRTS